MYSSNFEYFRPTTPAEAVEMLRAHPGAKLLAGGHSLLPQMKLRVAQPAALIDIGRLSELSGISLDGDSLHIGALTTHNSLAMSAVVQEHCPILSEAALQIGDQQVRNRGTVGGSLAHADPAADLPTVMMALGATFSALGPGGSRDIPAAECFLDIFTTALKPDEILTGVKVKAYGAGTGGAYLKHSHPASGFAVVGVAAIVMVKDGKCTGARIAVGGATPNPVLATVAGDWLAGQATEAATFATAAGKVIDAIGEPMSDHYASAAYRRQLATVLSRRALIAACTRATK
jgi:carbon-monoxide dehydrogenase medium subunit